MKRFSLVVLLFLLPFAFLADEKCMGKSEIFFVLDSSGSVTEYNWLVFMKSCKAIVNAFENVNEDGIRVSIIHFHSPLDPVGSAAYYNSIDQAAEILLPLSGNKQEILDKFDYMSVGCPTYEGHEYGNCYFDRNKAGFTPQCINRPGCEHTDPYRAFKRVEEELDANGREGVNRVVYFFTDGEPNGRCCINFEDGEEYTIQVPGSYYGTKIKKNSNGDCVNLSGGGNSRYCYFGGVPHGAERLKNEYKAWFVPVQIRLTRTECTTMMNYIASYDCLHFFIKDFTEAAFDPLVEQFSKLACLDMYGMEPLYGNRSTEAQLRVKGTGFFQEVPKDEFCTASEIQSQSKKWCIEECSDLQMKCRFEKENGDEFIVNANFINEEEIECIIPKEQTNETGQIDVEISLDGQFYVQRDQHYEVINDSPDFQEPLDDDACKCEGLSDLIFVLDSSYSVDDLEFEQLRNFTSNLLSKVCLGEENDFVHVSIIQFTTTSSSNYYSVDFNLTNNRNHILRTARNLGRLGKGATPLHSGLKAAYNQIIDNGRPEAYKFVVVISDGVTDSCKGINVDQDCIDPSVEINRCKDQYELCFEQSKNISCYWDIIEQTQMTSCCNCDSVWINKIESTGAFIFGVAVGNENSGDDLDQSYIKTQISSKPEYYAHANSFNEIENLIDIIVESTCIDVYYSDPGAVCFGDDIEMKIIGTGFSKNTEAIIRFYHNHDDLYIDYTYPEVKYVSKNTLSLSIIRNEANAVHFPTEGTYFYSVSIGGKFWSQKEQFTYDKNAATCQIGIEIVPIVSIVTLGILGLLLVLAIVLLLSLIMCGIKKKPVVAKAVELKEEELEEPAPLPEVLPESEPEPVGFLPPPKVKRSMYYVGGKAMSVDWGEKGMTWDSPFRGNNMGMGDSFGHNKKNKLYEEIQRRKMERLKRQNLINQQNNIKKPNINRSSKPTINREAKPKI